MAGILAMSISELSGRIALIVAGLSVIVQISPIKLNPWSWLAKKIGKAINGEVLTKMDEITDDLKRVHEEMDEKNAKDARTKILRFSDELLHNTMHSKDHFDEILLSITEYTQYCNEHPEFKNHMTDSSTKMILKTYEKCMEEHSFL